MLVRLEGVAETEAGEGGDDEVECMRVFFVRLGVGERRKQRRQGQVRERELRYQKQWNCGGMRGADVDEVYAQRVR